MRIKLPRSRGSQFYLVQLVGVGVGLLLLGLGPWRLGVTIIGITYLVAAVARSFVPLAHTGMLRVRSKVFDMAWMTLLGVSLVVLAAVIPSQPG